MGVDKDNSDASPRHEITLPDFLLGSHEVTFEEFDKFCTATNRKKLNDEGWGRGKRPAININFYDAIEYCNWLSEQEGYQKIYTIKGKDVFAKWEANGFRLPTEAEWEYAARNRGKNDTWAGTSNEQELSKYANFCDVNCKNSISSSLFNDGYENTSPVGSFLPNDLGLYDMSGNVWEWCWDGYDRDYYSVSEKNFPLGDETSAYRVQRGGFFGCSPECLFNTKREYSVNRDYRDKIVGFRLCRSLK